MKEFLFVIMSYFIQDDLIGLGWMFTYEDNFKLVMKCRDKHKKDFVRKYR